MVLRLDEEECFFENFLPSTSSVPIAAAIISETDFALHELGGPLSTFAHVNFAAYASLWKKILFMLASFLVFHVETSCAKPLSKTPENIRAKSLQEETSQSFSGWLKLKAFWNMVAIVLTFPTFHPEIFATKLSACSNIPCMFVADETSQLYKFVPLNALAFLNIFSNEVTELTSQSPSIPSNDFILSPPTRGGS